MTTLDMLEEQLRARHRCDAAEMTFQAYVDWLRQHASDPMHSSAVLYNRLVYELQNRSDNV